MANLFNSVEGLHPRRNAFSAHTYRNDFTSSLGLNIPVYLQHVTAGTRVKVGTSALVRLQALIAPVMDNIDFYLHFWQIPYRLLENDRFTQFISGEIEPEEYDAFFCTPYDFITKPLIGLWDHICELIDDNDKRVEAYNDIVGNGSLLDFLGYDLNLFPTVEYDELNDEFVWTGGNNTTVFNWRELFAYYMLHTNWYMNENVPYFSNFVETVETAYKSQSHDAIAKLIVQTYVTFGTTMLPHGWEKDYFTSALPNVQFGDPVTLPIGGSAPVSLSSEVAYADFNADGLSILYPKGTPSSLSSLGIDYTGNIFGRTVNDDPEILGDIHSNSTSLSGELSFINSDDEVIANPYVADLSEATAITINELRFANALQKFKERQLRFGRRRLEYYKGFFDVTPEDLRLQVPKYLGGGRIPINIADIEQTSKTDGSAALGHLAGKATAVAGGFAGFKTWCSEETIIIGIAFAMPHITYANTVSRFKLKTNDIYDYFNPSFEHLGEQAIKNIELFAGSETPDADFGYTPRYTEYRFL